MPMSMGLHSEFTTAKTDPTTDPVTGLCNSEPYLEQLYNHCITAKEKTYLITADFLNLSELNHVIGRELTNEVIQTITNIYHEELGALGADIYAGFRPYGDEPSFILGGSSLSQEQLANALKKAEERTQAFVTTSKLSQIQHPRLANVTGTGMTTTFTEINQFSRPITETKNGLSFQIQNMRAMLAKTAKNAHRADEFIQESYLDSVKMALKKYNTHHTVIDRKLPQGFAFTPVEQAQIRSRHDEINHLKDVTARGDSHFIRFNLYNLGGLNSLFGNDMVNRHILDVAAQTILETLEKEGLGHCPIYKRNGGEFDVILENADQNKINRIKDDVTNKLHERIFGQTIEAFTKQNQINLLENQLSANTAVGNISHKRERLPGAGFTIIDTPVPQNTNINLMFQNVESTKRLYEYHGLAYAEERGENMLRLRSIGAPSTDPRLLQYESLNTDGAVNYAWSLSNRLKPEQLQDIFKKPVGMIFEAITGISLLPVLDRQQIIFHLVSQGIDIDKIKTNLSPREKFDEFVQDQVIEANINPVDLAGRKSSHAHKHTEFLAFGLAKAWGYIPPKLEGIDCTLLKAQAALRALQELDDYRTGYRNDDSPKLLEEIQSKAHTILEDASMQSTTLETAQYVDHATKILKHVNAIEDEPPSPEVIHAGYSLVHETLLDIAQDFKRFGHHGLASNFEELIKSSDPGMNKMSRQAAFNAYDKALDAEMHEAKVILSHTHPHNG